EQIRRGYDFGPGYEVRMMGARNTLTKLAAAHELTLDDLPDNWVLMRHKAIDVVEFLGGLDFFLYLDNPHMHEAFGRTILEAAASGVLTIAHSQRRFTFGDTIDYALPGEAQALIADYVANPDKYAERVARSRAIVQERFSHEGFITRLRGLDGPPADHSPGSVSVIPPAGPSVRVSSGGRGERPEVLTSAPWRVRIEAGRSAADAGRADHIAVVHAEGAEVRVANWWGAHAQAHPGDTLPDALLSSAPEAVGAIVTVRDDLVHTAVRAKDAGEGAPPESDEERLLALAGLSLPEGWTATARWAHPSTAVPARAV